MHAGDNRILAATLISVALFLACTQDAMVKWISGGYPVHQVLVIRGLVALPLTALIAGLGPGLPAILTRHWPLTYLRGAILCSAHLAFILAIAAIPIADVVAVYFTMPFFVAALSWPLLGERVRPHRWVAIAAGFTGVVLANGVTKGILDPAVLLALWAAFGYALGQMIGRPLSRHVAPAVMACHQNVVYLAVAAVLALAFSAVDPAAIEHKSLAFLTRPWVWPTTFDFAIIASLGVFGAVAMVLFSSAYKYAESSFVAPFEYTGMLWAVLYGMTLWGDVPDRWVVMGGGIVILAGLFMIWRDRRIERAIAATA